MDNKNIYILGHKNPDTDSICSAIAYANLKNQISDSIYTPMRAGQISLETQFVLNRFNIEFPKYISDIRTQISDINIKRLEGVGEGISLRSAWKVMKETNCSTLAVVTDGKLKGIISIRDIATSHMDTLDSHILSKAKTPLKNIAETIDGEIVLGDPEEIFSEGKVLIGAANNERLEGYVNKGDIVLLGDREEAQSCAIEMGASCIVICVDAPVSENIIELAKAKGCSVVTSKHDTYTVARLINHSMPVKYFMTQNNLITFKTDAFTDDVKQKMAEVRFRDFPVVDKNDNYIGMISRRFLLGVERKKVILVDHNEKTQAVDGIGDAEILEIIDHHRIGNLETSGPVYFRNQPVGCTATIIYQLYQENCVEIPPHIAGLLCSAIISDTLLFRSPTCTPIDKRAAERLAEISGINPEKYAEEMFTAGSNFGNKSAEEIFYQDFKKFNGNGRNFGVGQITAMSQKELTEIEEKLLPYIKESLDKLGVEMIMFMLTNIMTESTNLLFVGKDSKDIVANAFNKEVGDHSVFLPKVVSRKKQLIPSIMAAIQ